MPNIQLSDAEGFRAWASMLINNQSAYEVDEVNADITFFNSDDTAYLVINVYASDVSCTQYSFIVENEMDKPKSVIIVFDFLKTVNFSLEKLLHWLTVVSWTDNERGNFVTAQGLIILRNFLTAT